MASSGNLTPFHVYLVQAACGLVGFALVGCAAPGTQAQTLCEAAALHYARCTGHELGLSPQCDAGAEEAAATLLEMSCDDFDQLPKSAQRNRLCWWVFERLGLCASEREYPDQEPPPQYDEQAEFDALSCGAQCVSLNATTTASSTNALARCLEDRCGHRDCVVVCEVEFHFPAGVHACLQGCTD